MYLFSDFSVLFSCLQDLYEATAEIDDANPCISVTIRLLSVQDKGCVYVDEIYVYADPVDSADSESPEKPHENSSGSSLMAMFVPTLMQLSKTTGLSNLSALRKEKSASDDLEATLASDSIIKTQLIGNTGITDPHEVKSKEVKEGWEGPSQPDAVSQNAKIESNPVAVPQQIGKMDSTCTVVHSKIAEMENNHSAVPFQSAKIECNHSSVPSEVGSSPESKGGFSLGGNVERVLEQLLSRMDRIEEICLGFQEKMVVPMSSMEARLQRVEQQLDTLTKNMQKSALPSHCRISSPDASCIESDANTSDNCPDYVVTRESEPDEKHLDAEIPCVSPHRYDSGKITQLLPGLVVTAPEFPDGEDEEGNASGQETSSLKDKGKHTIDDALSSALANFLSSTSINSPKYTKSLTFKAPEFLNEDDDDDDHGSNSEIAKNDSVCLAVSEEFSHIQVLASSDILENGEKINSDSNYKPSEKTVQEAEEDDQLCIAKGDQEEVHVKTNSLAEFNPDTGFIDNSEDDNGKINGQKSDGLLDNQTPCCYSITEEGPSSRTKQTVATEVPVETFHENILENVLGFSVGSSVVDFESPILDVKFISHTSPATERFLVDLLQVDTQETTSSIDPSVKENNVDISIEEQQKSNGDVSVEQQANLISIDEEPANLVSDSHFAVDKDLCTSMPVNIDSDNLPLPEDHKRKRDQVTWSPRFI